MYLIIYLLLVIFVGLLGHIYGDMMYKRGYDDGNFDGRKCYYDMEIRRYQRKVKNEDE